MLLKHNANVNDKRKDRVAPVLKAAQEDHANVCTRLLENNANVN